VPDSFRLFSDGRDRRFTCERCGNCCRRPGVVHFSATDIRRAAAFLEMNPREFRKTYLVKEDGRWLLEGEGDKGCLFFDEATTACRIQEAKPLQCRAWPFWPETHHSRSTWTDAARHCPGMGKGATHAPDEIREWFRAMEKLTGE
jgi:Fe-S-cluster containining protein